MKNTSNTRNSQVSQKDFSIYDYDKRLQRTWKLIKKELSTVNVELIEKYEITLIREQLAKATRLKNLERLLSLSRKLGKDWNDATQVGQMMSTAIMGAAIIGGSAGQGALSGMSNVDAQ